MSVGSLIVTGIAVGSLYVVTGPDHLSALVTLTANQDVKKSFFLGIHWGIAHSIGLGLMSAIFIPMSSGDDTVEVPHIATRVFEIYVGIFLLLLGCYGLVRAARKRQWAKQKEQRRRTKTTTNPQPPRPPAAIFVKSRKAKVADASMSLSDIEAVHKNEPTSSSGSSDEDSFAGEVAQFTTALEIAKRNSLNESQPQFPPPTGIYGMCVDVVNRVSSRTMVILLGSVQGMAGTAGVLGALEAVPAVQMKDWATPTLYLTCFCITSTLIMGCYAALYGFLSSMVGKGTEGEFRVESISACLSIVVGIMWIVLVSLDKLADIFPF